MSTNNRKRLGENLIEVGKINPNQLQEGLQYQKEVGLPIGKSLEQLGYICERDIVEALSRQLGIPYIGLLEEASEKLLKVLELDKILKYLIETAKKGTTANSGMVYVVSSDRKHIRSKVQSGKISRAIKMKIGQGIAGHVAETGEIINIRDAYMDPMFDPIVDRRTGYITKTLLCMPILNHNSDIIGVIQMINKKDGQFSEGDIKFLNSLSNFSATALELAALNQEMIDKKKLDVQLSIAREMQTNLFPKCNPEINNFQIFGVNKSCESVCGDYYDYFKVGEDKWIIAIGDVSGHGVASSYVMAVFQSHLKAITKYNTNLVEITGQLNEYITMTTPIDRFITFFIGLLDTKEMTMQYVNAGHNPPYLLSNNSIEQLCIGGPIIGMVKDLKYNCSEIKFDKNDLLFCFTDGVTESFDKDDKHYGEDRLKEFLCKNKDQNIETIVANSLEELAIFSNGAIQHDDITYLAVKRK